MTLTSPSISAEERKRTEPPTMFMSSVIAPAISAAPPSTDTLPSTRLPSSRIASPPKMVKSPRRVWPERSVYEPAVTSWLPRTISCSAGAGASSVGATSVGATSVGAASVGAASVGAASVGAASVGAASVGAALVGAASVGSGAVGNGAVGNGCGVFVSLTCALADSAGAEAAPGCETGAAAQTGAAAAHRLTSVSARAAATTALRPRNRSRLWIFNMSCHLLSSEAIPTI